MTVTDAVIDTTKKVAQAPVPEKGFYVALNYMHGDADGYETVDVGPFPDENKRLYLEFLNVLEAMSDRYPNGKGGFDGYEDVPGYLAWFDREYDPETEDDTFRDQFGLETLHSPGGYGCIAKLTGYECWYHDGRTTDKYPVKSVMS